MQKAISLTKDLGNDGGVTLRRIGAIGSAQARVVVSRVDARAAQTGLQVSQQVISTNNIDVSVLSEAAVQDILVQNDLVTFLVEPYPTHTSGLAVAHLPTSDALSTKLICDFQENEHKQICVGHDKDNAGKILTALCPDLKPGMVVRSINNVDVTGKSSSEVTDLFTNELSSRRELNLSNSTGIITILAQTPEEAAPKKDQESYKYTTVSVNDPDTPLEIDLVVRCVMA